MNFKKIILLLILFSDFLFSKDAPFLVSPKKAIESHEDVFQIRVKNNEVSENDLKIRMKYEPSLLDRKLGLGVTRKNNNVLRIAPYINYPNFIVKKELLFFKPGENKLLFKKMVNDVVNISEDDFNKYDLKSFDLVLKVYDKNNIFDKTHRIKVMSTPGKVNEFNSGYGVSRIMEENIPLSGGTITVYGSHAQPSSVSRFENLQAPVDLNGKFVMDIIIPHGTKRLELEVTDKSNKRRKVVRNVEIQDNKIFFFALLDITYSNNKFSGPLRIQEATSKEFESEYVDGQLGFYLRGKVKGEYLITAMLASGEDRFQSLFRNLDSKNANQIFRRLDADKFYPVYGDNSSTEETAPSQGKFYIKLQKHKSYIMWGNYETKVLGSDFTQINRSLYGAKVNLESSKQTKFGESKSHLVTFLSNPSTFPMRDEFRGTGGSVYFLSFQDITRGSEKLRIEIRDRHSGIVKSVKHLVYGKDYDINFLQGRVILNEPLSSTSGDGDIISSGVTQAGDPNFLVLDYEVTPTSTVLRNNYFMGGSFDKWFGDYFKLGVVGSKQKMQVGSDQELYGANFVLRASDTSYLKGSYSVSNGVSSNLRRSYDGGYNSNVSSSVSSSSSPEAYNVEASLDFLDIFKSLSGRLSGYYQDRDAGYTSLGFSSAQKTLRQGGVLIVGDQREGLYLKGELDYSETGASDSNRHLAQLGYEGDTVFGALGYGLEKNNSINKVANLGGRLGLRFGETRENNVYIFGQATTSHEGNYQENSRLGLGSELKLTQKIKLGGEVSQLTKQKKLGANAKVLYDYSHGTQFYLGYDLSENRNNTGQGYEGITSQSGGLGQFGNFTTQSGALTAGTKTRFSSSVSLYAEETSFHGTGQDGFTRTYGVDLTPWENTNIGANFERGIVNNLDRIAVGMSAGYGNEGKHISVAGEYRKDKNQSSGDERKTYVGKLNSKLVLDDQFTLLLRGNVSISENNQANINDGEFVEGSFGVAYRPRDHDNLNILGRYRYFYDIPTQNQSLVSGVSLFKQKSHVLSLDMNLNISKYLTLGGKYGFKIGEEDLLTGLGWTRSKSQIAILRGDLHLVHKLDFLIEGRWKNQVESKDTSYGFLSGLYYHVGKNLRLGGGYSWSDFSNDLTNLNLNNRGYFINLVSKF